MSQTIVQPNIFPILRYRDATAAMSWLARAFGFETRMEVPGPDGTVAHAELRLGAGTIGVSSKTPPDGKNPWTTVDQGVYVSVDNSLLQAGTDISRTIRKVRRAYLKN